MSFVLKSLSKYSKALRGPISHIFTQKPIFEDALLIPISIRSSFKFLFLFELFCCWAHKFYEFNSTVLIYVQLVHYMVKLLG